MKSAFFLSLFLILAHSHEQGTPIMAKLILKNSLNKKSADSSLGCYKASHTTSDKVRLVTDYFNASVSCSVKCEDSVQQQISIVNEFNPSFLGLYEGDGSSQEKILWRSLGHTLNIWGKDQCSRAAKSQCKKVESFKLNKISSGSWSMGAAFNCKDSKFISSPFGKEETLEKNLSSKLTPFIALNPLNINKSVLSSYIDKTINKDLLSNYIVSASSSKSCKHKAKLKTCFGDCIFETEKNNWKESISTTEPYGDEQIQICLDDYAGIIKQQKTASDKDLVCHKLIWEILMKSNAFGTSCAAFRYDYECPNSL